MQNKARVEVFMDRIGYLWIISLFINQNKTNTYKKRFKNPKYWIFYLYGQNNEQDNMIIMGQIRISLYPIHDHVYSHLWSELQQVNIIVGPISSFLPIALSLSPNKQKNLFIKSSPFHLFQPIKTLSTLPLRRRRE